MHRALPACAAIMLRYGLRAPVAQWSTVLFGEPKSSGLSSRRPRVRFPPGASSSETLAMVLAGRASRLCSTLRAARARARRVHPRSVGWRRSVATSRRSPAGALRRARTASDALPPDHSAVACGCRTDGSGCVLTFRVKDDLYVAAGRRPLTRKRIVRVNDDRDKGPVRWVLLHERGAGEREAGDEAGGLPGAAHASRAARSLAVPALALPARSPLARADPLAGELLLDGSRAFDGWTAGMPPAAPRRLREGRGAPTRIARGGAIGRQAGAGGGPGSHPPLPRSLRSRRSAPSRPRVADRGPCPRRSVASRP